MTMTTDFNSWKQKFIEATSKLKLNKDDGTYQSTWGVRQRTASDNMHRISNVLSSNPEREDLGAERRRTGLTEESILAKWKNKIHPIVIEYNSLVKTYDEYLKKLPENIQLGH